MCSARSVTTRRSIRAADDGNVDVVRVLLEAGADRTAKYQGQTALALIEERLGDSDYDDFQQEYREIAALLGAAPTKRGSASDSVKADVAKFAANARRPAYVRLRERLISQCGAGRAWKPQPDHGLPAKNVVAFTIEGCKQPKTVDDLQSKARDAGCHLVLAEPWSPGEDAKLVLFPTDNKLAVVAAVGTEGANNGVQTSKVMSWLETLDNENPFHLVLCNHESVGGAFVGPVKAAGKLAEKIAAFCPIVLDGEVDDAEKLARAIKKGKSFLLRWD